MPSLATAGRKHCAKDTLGGNKAAFFINFVDDSFTVVDGEATAINVAVTDVFKYELLNDGNIFDQNIVSDFNAGTTTNTQTITLLFPKLDKDTALQVDLLAKGRPVIVMQDRQGKYRVAGILDGCDLTGSTLSSGGAKADFNGFNLTFTATDQNSAPTLTADTLTALLALVSENQIEA
ncbi:hypothetical protein LCGC14_1395720 [marine sediment metagenome]|uniref:Uncharacterized protein n=2 Tax=root TaxID=1 RepID=A0A831QUB4_9FLAO|nr:hypothetical protein [Pricia sp.]HEA22746.1 hypothetical protein [Pricia antarctica]